MPKTTVCPRCSRPKDYRAAHCIKCKVGSRTGKYGKTPMLQPNGYLAYRLHKKLIHVHREAMARHLGRVLSRYEHVHHKDGNKLNNSIENLEVLSASEHHRLHMPYEVAKAMSIKAHVARWGA